MTDVSYKFNNTQIAANSYAPASNNRRLSFADSYTPPLLDGRRDLDQEFGYKTNLTFNDWFRLFNRSFGRAVVTVTPSKVWQSYPVLKENNKTDTPFLIEFNRLAKRTRLFKVMSELHTKSLVGEYGALFIAAKEVDGRPNKPLELASSENIVAIRSHYQVELSEEGSPVVSNPSSERFGLPEYFEYKGNSIASNNNQNAQSFTVDPSRVFTFSQFASQGSVRGDSILESTFNYIVNIEKIVGGVAEGFYKAAGNKRFYEITDPSLAKGVLSDDDKKAEFEKSDYEFDSGFSSSKLLGGMKVSQLQNMMSDPESPVSVNMQLVCSILGISTTEFIGHLTGERASSENSKGWNNKCEGIRENIINPDMIMGFIRHIDNLGGWVNSPDYDALKIEWPDLNEPSQSEKLDTMKKKYEIAKLAKDAGEDNPFPDVNENRIDAGFEAIEVEEIAGEGE